MLILPEFCFVYVPAAFQKVLHMEIEHVLENKLVWKEQKILTTTGFVFCKIFSMLHLIVFTRWICPIMLIPTG